MATTIHDTLKNKKTGEIVSGEILKGGNGCFRLWIGRDGKALPYGQHQLPREQWEHVDRQELYQVGGDDYTISKKDVIDYIKSSGEKPLLCDSICRIILVGEKHSDRKDK